MKKDDVPSVFGPIFRNAFEFFHIFSVQNIFILKVNCCIIQLDILDSMLFIAKQKLFALKKFFEN